MNIEEILTTYWSQTTLILLGLGYLFKIWQNHRQNKSEKNHEIVQNLRIKTINDFFNSYFDCERMWHGLKIYQVLKNEISVDEVDKYVGPRFIELQRAIFAMQLVLDEKAMELALEVEIKNNELYKKLGQLFMMRNDEAILPRANEYEGLREETREICRDRIIKLNKMIKREYF